MIANYGYKDGSGNYFISINTDLCDGCGKCVEACPQGVFEVTEDPNDPLRDEPVAVVKEEFTKKLKYVCTPCKKYLKSLTAFGEKNVEGIKNLPCVSSCPNNAIDHSW